MEQSPRGELVRDYKEYSAGYNDNLRGEEPGGATASDKATQAFVGKMDAALNETSTTQELTVYRGFGFADPQEMLGKGGTLRDKAYLSTLTDIDVAKGFAAMGKDAYVAKITVPVGSRAIVIGNDHQSEVILPRGLTLQVNGVDHAARTISFKIKGGM